MQCIFYAVIFYIYSCDNSYLMLYSGEKVSENLKEITTGSIHGILSGVITGSIPGVLSRVITGSILGIFYGVITGKQYLESLTIEFLEYDR